MEDGTSRWESPPLTSTITPQRSSPDPGLNQPRRKGLRKQGIRHASAATPAGSSATKVEISRGSMHGVLEVLYTVNYSTAYIKNPSAPDERRSLEVPDNFAQYAEGIPSTFHQRTMPDPPPRKLMYLQPKPSLVAHGAGEVGGAGSSVGHPYQTLPLTLPSTTGEAFFPAVPNSSSASVTLPHPGSFYSDVFDASMERNAPNDDVWRK